MKPFPTSENRVRRAGAAAVRAALEGCAAPPPLCAWPGISRCGLTFLSFLSLSSRSAIAVSATETSLWTDGMIVGPLAGSAAVAARTVEVGAERTSNAIVAIRTHAEARLRLNTDLPHR